jgi:hypothetical protein
VPRNSAPWKFSAKLWECLLCGPKFGIELSWIQAFLEGIMASILQVFQIFQELVSRYFIRKLEKMGKLTYSGNEVINFCKTPWANT